MVWWCAWCRMSMSVRKMALALWLTSHHTHMPYTAHQVHRHTKPLTWWQFGLLAVSPLAFGFVVYILVVPFA